MEQLAGKTAVISGGAEGIGFNLAQTFGRAGMNIVIADIDGEHLAHAEALLSGEEIPTLAVQMDVALKEDWGRLAGLASARFGKLHLLVNNAGVGGGIGSVQTLDEAGWRWAIDVNLMGVVYGANTLVPLILEHGEPGWIINVASMAGMVGAPLGGAYTATKAAVVALSEAWAQELAPDNIHVAVLAPAFVQTRIHESQRNRQERYASDTPPTADVLQVAAATSQAVAQGLDVEIIGQRVLEALAAGERYIFTHPSYQVVTDNRASAIEGAFRAAAASPLLQDAAQRDIASFDSH